MKFVKRDVVLWLRHLEEAGCALPSGTRAKVIDMVFFVEGGEGQAE